MKKLALITVIFKNYTILDDYFAALAKQSDVSFHVYAVDLTPTPTPYTFPSYVTVIHAENKGYASGINRGVTQAIEDGYEIVAPMNNDVTVNEHFISTIKHLIEKYPHSIVGGKIYYAPGYEYHTKRYSPNEKGKVLWYAGGAIDWNNVITPHRGVDEVDKGQYDKEEKTGFITGCFMAYDTTVVAKLGKWDESYFLFYEDAEFCARATQYGTPLIYCPSLIIWHKSGQSTLGAASSFQQFYHDKSRLKFGLSYAPLRTKLHLVKNFLLHLVKK